MRKFYFSVFMCFIFLSGFSFSENADDTVPPVWTSFLPPDITADCGNIPTAETLTATDDSGTVTVTFSDQFIPGNCPGNFILNRTWTATDPSGNSITHTQFIFVLDTMLPLFVGNLPADITIGCDAELPEVPVLTAIDNCSTATVTFGQETLTGMEGNGFKTIARTWMALDECGNSSFFTQLITVLVPNNPFVQSIIQPTCANPIGTVTIGGLPNENWTLSIFTNGSDLQTINGNTPTTVVNLAPEIYSVVVSTSPNCTSTTGSILVGYDEVMSLVMDGVFQDYNNDGFMNVGDVVNYQFTLTNNFCNPLTNVTLTSQTLSIVGNPIASLDPETSDSTTFSATYVLTQADITNGQITHTAFAEGTSASLSMQVTDSSTETTALNTSNGLLLKAFLDTNSDGIQNNGEPNFNQGSFNYAINGGTVTSVSSSSSSIILYESNPSNTYALSYTVPSAQYACATTFNAITVPNGSGITTYNFPVTTLPFDDLAVYVTSFQAPPRPGFTYQNQITIHNQGNQTIPAGMLTFSNDPTVSIVSVAPAGSVSTPTGFTYNFTNLLANTSITLYVTMQVPTIPTVSLGQQLTHTASVSIPNGDINVTNNTSSITQTIVGSYDPNDKQESHGGQIQFDTFSANDYLTYTIRFENTGTANAINVRVEDVLDAQLDETSIRMVSASHDYVLERVGSNLTWKFSGIELPPSVPDTQIGHGYITFQIKPKTGFAIGDIIENTAEIYFDFNPAIVTNTHATEFVETLGSASFAFSNLNYFPNPVKNSLMISNDTLIESVAISSVLGQQMMSQKVNSLETEINMSVLSNGIYFVKVVSDGAEKTIKIIKE